MLKVVAGSVLVQTYPFYPLTLTNEGAANVEHCVIAQ